MNDQDDTDRTAAQLRDALRAAADVMVAKRAAEPQRHAPCPPRPARPGRLFPLAAAAAVVVIALGTVFIAHLVSAAGKSAAASRAVRPGASRRLRPRPEGRGRSST